MKRLGEQSDVLPAETAYCGGARPQNSIPLIVRCVVGRRGFTQPARISREREPEEKEEEDRGKGGIEGRKSNIEGVIVRTQNEAKKKRLTEAGRREMWM